MTENQPPGPQEPFRSGFVAITGRPNTGKSTFLNRVLGRKAAIVSPKAQTTRSRILGIHNRPGCQMVFIDTPGIHAPNRSALNQAMVRTAFNACREVDAVLYFVDAAHGIKPEDRDIIGRLPLGKAPLLLVINKVDLVARERLLPRLQASTEGGLAFAEAVPLSALNGDNVERLLGLLTRLLPPGPRYFPEETWTDQPERFIAGEIIREKLFFNLQQELPYAMGVRVEGFQERPGASGLWDLEATILVERTSQKPIVIGRQGAMLKKIGTAARLELERFFNTRIHLRLQVLVKPNWTADNRLLRELGYAEEGDDAD